MIGGVKWTITLEKKRQGGHFAWGSHKIEIEKNISKERQFNILMHEVIEAIMVNNYMRFAKCLDTELHNGDYLFCFDHERFDIFVEELSGVLKQMGVVCK